MVILAVIERDDKKTVSNITMYLPDGEILCDFYGVTNEIIDWVENDQVDWPKDSEMFKNNTFLVYELDEYIGFDDLKHKKENAIYSGTALELIKKAKDEYGNKKFNS